MQTIVNPTVTTHLPPINVLFAIPIFINISITEAFLFSLKLHLNILSHLKNSAN